MDTRPYTDVTTQMRRAQEEQQQGPKLLNNSTAALAYQEYLNRYGGHLAGQAERDLNRAGNEFSDRFSQVVGRVPSDEEMNRFYADVLSGEDVGLSSRPNDLRPILSSYIEDRYGAIAGEERKKALGEKAKGSYGQVGDLIKNTLGRDATQAEVEHFSKLMASGDADEYTLGEALKTLPEYVERQDTQAREKLRGELSTADQRFFEKDVLPSIQSRFAQQGRSVDSSGFASALANVAGDVSAERENYLAGLGREDYTNRRQMAINNYLSNLQRTYAQQDYGRARADQLSDAYRQRGYDIQDYDTQKRAYDEYLRNYGVRKKSGGFLASGGGSLIGMGLGAALAAPTGGMSIPMGAMLGGSIGGSAGGMFGGY